MKVPEIGEGVCFGVGKANYRVAKCDETGGISSFYKIPTPDNTAEFCGQTARTILNAADRGAKWSLMGAPGPVFTRRDSDGVVRQTLRVTNIPALCAGFDPVAEMTRCEPAVGRLFSSGEFTHHTINDGDMAVLAGAKLFGTTASRSYNVIGDLIVGSGVGSAVARRDHMFPEANLFHTDQGLWELGHSPIASGLPSHTYERSLSAAALARICAVEDAKDIPHEDLVWDEVGRGMGSLTMMLALTSGAELVVMSGGIGVGEQNGYGSELRRSLDSFAKSNNPMADRVPEVQFVSKDMSDTYEMHGAYEAMVSFMTRNAIYQLVQDA